MKNNINKSLELSFLNGKPETYIQAFLILSHHLPATDFENRSGHLNLWKPEKYYNYASFYNT